MTADSPKSFRLFAVVALKRADLTESVIALRRDETEARRLAGQYTVVGAGAFLRCRVQPMDLTVEQVKAICYRWGQEDARSGSSVPNTLPGVYGEEYRLGYEAVRQASATAIQDGSDAADAGKEAR